MRSKPIFRYVPNRRGELMVIDAGSRRHSVSVWLCCEGVAAVRRWPTWQPCYIVLDSGSCLSCVPNCSCEVGIISFWKDYGNADLRDSAVKAESGTVRYRKKAELLDLMFRTHFVKMQIRPSIHACRIN